MVKMINSRQVRAKKLVDLAIKLISQGLNKKLGKISLPPDIQVFIDPILPKKK